MAHSTENIIIITSYVDAPFDMKQALTQMKDPYIICTDGGFDLAKRAGITPHLLLGDLDSIQSRIRKKTIPIWNLRSIQPLRKKLLMWRSGVA